MDPTQTPEVKAIEDMVRRSSEPRTIHLKDGELAGDVLLLPKTGGGVEVMSVKKLLAEFRDKPERRTGTAEMADLDSFSAHVKRFADDHTAIFADANRTNPSLVAVLDYHEKTATGAPAFGSHRTRYAFPVSRAWKAWTAQSGQAMSQDALASWLEDHLEDIADPSNAGEMSKEFATRHGVSFATPARLLELSKGLVIHVGQKIENRVNLATGEIRLQFEESHTDAKGGPLTVPGAFIVAIPVFDRGVPFSMPTRLKYRMKDQQIAWFFELHCSDDTFDSAIGEAIDTVAKTTGAPVFRGKPEAG